MKISSLLISVFVGVFVLSLATLGRADLAQIKVYKEAFPGSKPKCLDCHTMALPKKDGDHGLNDYANKVKALAETITVEEYKKVGSIEDSKIEK
ncbi:MAG: hypothetical protein H6753_04505 [Candidatus Omnitrophica bacterium]|nr:hypothetical protein [Candidatus Omnitrophota bacterium]